MRGTSDDFTTPERSGPRPGGVELSEAAAGHELKRAT